MSPDLHDVFRRKIDQALADEVSPQDQESLREHLHSCAKCRDYLSSCNRAIASLSGFSFELDPTLQSRVIESVRLRSPLAAVGRLSRVRIAGSCVIALLLTAVGSIVDLKFGSLVASTFDIQRAEVQQGLLTFWVIPSLCLLVVFPLLPLLSASSAHRKGITHEN